VSYTWNFGDGTIGTSALVSHHYTATGKYAAIVSAANSVNSLTKTVEVVVANGTASVIPTATALVVFPSLPGAALPVTLTAFIPIGTVASPANLVYTVLPTDTHSAPAKFNFAGANFNLEMYLGSVWQSDYQFNTPITLTLDYDPADLGLNENTLELRYWNGSAWVGDGLTLLQRDTVHHRLIITLTHLSEFALLGQKGYKICLPLIRR
jgi:PKD repeat protein